MGPVTECYRCDRAPCSTWNGRPVCGDCLDYYREGAAPFPDESAGSESIASGGSDRHDENSAPAAGSREAATDPPTGLTNPTPDASSSPVPVPVEELCSLCDTPVAEAHEAGCHNSSCPVEGTIIAPTPVEDGPDGEREAYDSALLDATMEKYAALDPKRPEEFARGLGYKDAEHMAACLRAGRSVPPVGDQDELRELIAEALWNEDSAELDSPFDWRSCPESAVKRRYMARADAVLAVLPSVQDEGPECPDAECTTDYICGDGGCRMNTLLADMGHERWVDAWREASDQRDQCRSERDEAVHHVKQLLADLEGWREGRDSMVGDEERAAEEFLVRVVSEGNVGKDGAQ